VLSLLAELERMPAELGRTLQRSGYTLAQAESAIAYRSWDELARGRRQLGNFDGRSRSRGAARLESYYDKWQASNAAEILQRVKSKFLENVRLAERSATQLSAEQREFKRRYSQGRRTLEHEFGKTMRYKAIRELVEGDAALVIRDLKPVWLMSPLSVSDTLPLADELFDVVIFDEASQVPLEESVPTIFRGKQVIVVGDEMQLPPTDFFSAKQADEEEEMVVEEAGQRLNYDLDSDSLLNHAARNLPSTMLGWHYRSRSESLISFSNWAFYDGRLLTVPDHELLLASVVPHGDAKSDGEKTSSSVDQLLNRPVSFHHLRDGVYDQRQNRREAAYIAEMVAGLLKRGAGLSIGVIAFSEAQQTEIEAALTRLARDDEEFRQLYEAELEREDDGQFVGLLVKNLENIQGDERDVVILSVCYGPGPNGRMLMNFGPINKSGGEKRLNVAFSRAKRRMAIVSSIQHTAITNDYNDGAACLKNYLRYAEALSGGDLESAKRVLSGIARWREAPTVDEQVEDPVCSQLAARLRERGYLVERNIGQSHFRVDLAVRQRGEQRHRLGILVDTPSKYEHSDAMERDMLRPRLLRAFGWKLAVVLASDWYANREQEFQRILALVEQPDSELESLDDDGEISEAEDDEIQSTPVDRSPAIDVLDLDGDGPADSDSNPGAENLISPAPANPSPVHDGAVRYFEFKDDKSSKFWEILLHQARHTVRFGRIGSEGQSQTKEFPDAAAAARDADRLVQEKLRKGYREITGTATQNPE
jgi:predicted DNA-binding WGR domain protein